MERGIYRLDGFYYAEFYDQFKKRHIKKCSTLQFARRYLSIKRTEVWQNRFDPTSVRSEKDNLTFDSLAKERLDTSKGDKQYKAELGRLNWWRKRFKNCLVKSISHQDISKALVDLAESGKKPSTRNRYLTSLKATFNLGITNERIEKSPCRNIQRVKENNQAVRWLKPSEEKQLLEVMPLRNQLLVKIALHTGLRRGEQMSLQWSDVDFKRRQITIRETKVGVVQCQPMNETAFEAFKKLRELPLHVSGEVFYWINQWTGDPNMKQYQKLGRTWKRYCEMAGIDKCRWHDLRHSFASRLVIAGESIVVVKELMRHSNINITMRYIHLAPSSTQNALNVLDKVYDNPEIWEEIDLQQPPVQPSVKTVNS